MRLLKQRKKRDDALCLLILSGLCFALSVVFLILSFRFNHLREKVFTPASLEFVIFVISFVLFGVLLGIGLFKLHRSQKMIKLLMEE